MLSTRSLILGIVSILLIAGCEKNRHARFVGQWQCNNTIWYTSELTLQNNGTFKYHEQTCYGQKFTAGQWSDDNGTISLISYDNFKPLTESKAIMEVSEYQTEEQLKSQKGIIKYAFKPLKVTVTLDLNLTSSNDTIRVYFDKLQLHVSNDTMYSMTPNEYISDHKFSRTKNNR